MSDLRSLLLEHSAIPRRELDVDALVARARRRRLRNRVAAWVSGLAAHGAIAVPVEQVLVPAAPSGEVRTVQPPSVGGQRQPAQGLPAPTPPPAGSLRASSAARPRGLNASSARTAGSGAAPAPAPPMATGGSNWAIPPGYYSYDVKGYANHPGDPMTESMGSDNLSVDAPSGSDQHSVRDLSDSSGATYEFGQTVEHRTDGFHLVGFSRIYNSSSTDTSDCQMSSAPLVLPVSPKPGYHLNVTIPNCRYYFAGNLRPADLTVDILQTGSVTVGATPVPAVQMRFEVAFNGGQTSTQNEDDVDYEWVRPTDGLVLQEHRTDRFTTGASNNATTDTWGYDATLYSTKPSP